MEIALDASSSESEEKEAGSTMGSIIAAVTSSSGFATGSSRHALAMGRVAKASESIASEQAAKATLDGSSGKAAAAPHRAETPRGGEARVEVSALAVRRVAKTGEGAASEQAAEAALKGGGGKTAVAPHKAVTQRSSVVVTALAVRRVAKAGENMAGEQAAEATLDGDAGITEEVAGKQAAAEALDGNGGGVGEYVEWAKARGGERQLQA